MRETVPCRRFRLSRNSKSRISLPETHSLQENRVGYAPGKLHVALCGARCAVEICLQPKHPGARPDRMAHAFLLREEELACLPGSDERRFERLA